MLILEWKKREGTQEQAPAEIDQTSSPSTVYLRRNIEQIEREDGQGNTVKVWQYDEAQVSNAEYAELQQMASVFSMPAFLNLQEQVNNQQLVLADVAMNTEYTVCLQEINNI